MVEYDLSHKIPYYIYTVGASVGMSLESKLSTQSALDRSLTKKLPGEIKFEKGKGNSKYKLNNIKHLK